MILKEKKKKKSVFFYRIADIGSGHGFSIVIDVFKLAVNYVIVGRRWTSAMIDVAKTHHPSAWFRQKTSGRVCRHTALTGTKGRSFATILSKRDYTFRLDIGMGCKVQDENAMLIKFRILARLSHSKSTFVHTVIHLSLIKKGLNNTIESSRMQQR